MLPLFCECVGTRHETKRCKLPTAHNSRLDHFDRHPAFAPRIPSPLSRCALPHPLLAMASRKPELTTILLDVGPAMHPNLDAATRGLSDFLESKIVKKPTHQTALIFFGTTATANPAAEEQASKGEMGEYAHITVAHEMRVPDIMQIASLRRVASSEEAGTPDFVDALIVALDTLVKLAEQRPELKGSKKTLILESNFLTPLVRPADEDTLDHVVSTLKSHAIRLRVISIDIPEDDSLAIGTKNVNADVIAQICARLGPGACTVQPVTLRAFLAGAFKAHEYGIIALAKVDLQLGTAMAIPVRLVHKAKQQGYWPLGKERGSGGDGEESDGLGKRWDRDTEYFMETAEGVEIVPWDERQKAYRYGKQSIPVDEMDEVKLKYGTDAWPLEKGLQLVGFTTAASVPREAYMGEPLLLVAAKETPPAGVALSTLVQAMSEQGSMAILRWTKAKVRILGAIPVLSSPLHPAHLLCLDLPYAEDVRECSFPSLNKPDRQPNETQEAALDDLVQAMSLVTPGKEALVPEQTPNPCVHRFMAFLWGRAINPGLSVPDQDLLVDAVTQPPFHSLPGALTAAQTAAAAFPTGGAAKQQRRAVYRLRAGHESEDFTTMMAQGAAADAISQMRKHIEAVVDASPGDASFGAAVTETELFRDVCLKHSHGKAFNDHFLALCGRYLKVGGRQGEFCRRLAAAGVTLVGGVDGVPTTAEEAAAFLEKLKEGGVKTEVKTEARP